MTVPAALLVGYLLDLALGDPPRWPHLVVGIGKLISFLEKLLRRLLPKTPGGELAGGTILVVAVLFASLFVPLAILAAAYQVHPLLGFLLECFVCYQVLATRCLADAGRLVYDELKKGDLSGARRAVARVVGRDTDSLDAAGVTRAAVETVAENCSDGVVAPMLFFAVGGAPLAILYKAVNTMDSMLGYKNEKYLFFGRAAARLDDAANFVPARATALLMIPAAALAGLDWRGALCVWRRDRLNHTSPNAGNPEAACAGALGVRLGGGSVYGGKMVEKPGLGDDARPIEPEDIAKTNRLLYRTSALCFAFCFFLALAMHWTTT